MTQCVRMGKSEEDFERFWDSGRKWLRGVFPGSGTQVEYKAGEYSKGLIGHLER